MAVLLRGSLVALLGLLVLLAGPPRHAQAFELERRVPATTEAFLGQAAGAPLLGLLTLPVGRSGPLPVVIFLPDIDGSGGRTALYGDRLLENGWAIVELFPGLEHLAQVPQPLAAALRTIAADARLEAGRTLLVGLGAGARTALAAWAAGAPVGRLALFYPGCDAALVATARGATPSLPTSQMLLLHGGADPANTPDGCADLVAALPAGTAALHRILPGASYAWDAAFMVRPGGLAKLPHPGDPALRVVARPDLTTALIGADRLLAFAVGGE